MAGPPDGNGDLALGPAVLTNHQAAPREVGVERPRHAAADRPPGGQPGQLAVVELRGLNRQPAAPTPQHPEAGASPIRSSPPAAAAGCRPGFGRAWRGRGRGARRSRDRSPLSLHPNGERRVTGRRRARLGHGLEAPVAETRLAPQDPRRSRRPGPPGRGRRRPRAPRRRPRTGRPQAGGNRSEAVRGWSVERLLVAVGEALRHLGLREVGDRHVIAQDLRRRGQLVGPGVGLPGSGADQRLRAVDERRLDLDADPEGWRARPLTSHFGQELAVSGDAGGALHAQRLAQAGYQEEHRGPRVGEQVGLRVEPAIAGKSGTSSRRRSSTRTKPGGPPRGETSQRPWSSAVASMKSGERAMKSRQ